MKQASLLLAVVFAVSPLYAEVWVMATGHPHTLYSDGGNTMLQVGRKALATGSRFCAIVDHVEAIDLREKGALNFWQPEKLFGFDGWAADLSTAYVQLHREGLELVPGGEGALDTRPEGLMGANHVVMMGGPVAIYAQMQRLVVQSGDPDLMASRLHELASASGAVLVAAHPNCSAYKFDNKLLRWVDAIEIFDGTADPMSELRRIGDHPEARNRTIAVVTGSDFHADDVSRLDTLGKVVRLKPVEMARAANPLARHIWAPVSSPKATREELIGAIRQRRTYASIAPARITTAKTMPGGKHDTREVLGMRLDGMNWALGRNVNCLLVRRGSGDVREWEVPISVTGATTGDFLLDFAKLPPAVLRDGSFLYLMVANQIATSGLELAPRPDVVVAKKPGLFEQAGDLLGQVAEVLSPTAPTTPRQEPSSPTPPSNSGVSGVVYMQFIDGYENDDFTIRFEIRPDLIALVSIAVGPPGRAVVWTRVVPFVEAERKWMWENKSPTAPFFPIYFYGSGNESSYVSAFRLCLYSNNTTWTSERMRAGQFPDEFDAGAFICRSREGGNSRKVGMTLRRVR